MSISPGYKSPPPPRDNEQEMVEAAKKRPEAFEPLYKKYFEPVYRFVYQRLDDMDTAKDITQQVFINAMVNLSKYEYRGLPFSSWLYRIAINELNKLFNKNKAHRTLNIETEGLEEMMEEMQEDRFEEYYPLLEKAMLDMDPENLAMLEMRFFEKRSFKEIGEILDITENNAKVRLYRLLDKIKSVLRVK
ncbi:MAG TPA: sigma-70 family RNA polymerase sigma factor [Bacteroidia bacterium]|nr:sigma-70 family RNA polymerase sigma factor [Bacteroidia bacterium]